jgi:hypothetical protein
LRKSFGNTVSTVSSVRAGPGPGPEQHYPGWASAAFDDSGRLGPRPSLSTAADDADGADAKAAFPLE